MDTLYSGKCNFFISISNYFKNDTLRASCNYSGMDGASLYSLAFVVCVDNRICISERTTNLTQPLLRKERRRREAPFALRRRRVRDEVGAVVDFTNYSSPRHNFPFYSNNETCCNK